MTDIATIFCTNTTYEFIIQDQEKPVIGKFLSAQIFGTDDFVITVDTGTKISRFKFDDLRNWTTHKD